MGLAIQRLNDANDAGGSINTIPQSTVFVDKLLVAVNGSTGTGHPPCPFPNDHCSNVWKTAGGASTVLIGGIPINTTNNIDTCTHIRVGGSSTVFIG